MTDPADRVGPTEGPGTARPPAMPRWVKVTAIIVGGLLLVFVILQLTGLAGQHGPGRHESGAGDGVQVGVGELPAVPAPTDR